MEPQQDEPTEPPPRGEDAPRETPPEWLPAGGVPYGLEDVLYEPGTIARVDGLRLRLQPRPQAALDRLLAQFLGRTEWHVLSPLEAEETFASFLELLEQALERRSDGRRASVRLRELDEFFARIGARPLLERRSRPRPEPVVGLAEAAREIRRDLLLHSPLQSSIVVIYELLVHASDEKRYAVARRRFLEALGDARFDSVSIARLLRHLAAESAPPRWESRDGLVDAVLAHTGDLDAFVLFLASLADRPDATRPILDRLVARPAPFHALHHLLVSPVLVEYRAVLAEKLVEAARLRGMALLDWARSERAGFFAPEVFGPLLSAGVELVAAPCREILVRGNGEDRRRLIDLLVRNGTERALRLLVLGLCSGTEVGRTDLVRAVAAFEHPLAVSALREVVHRTNASGKGLRAAAEALRGLASQHAPEAAAFVREVTSRRAGLLPLYRRGLRHVAARRLRARHA